MKRFLLAIIVTVGISSPANAWWDSYGGFTCGYMDPLTSVLDDIFGPPCPPPVAVAVPAPPPPPVQPVPVQPVCALIPMMDWWGNIIGYRQTC